MPKNIRVHKDFTYYTIIKEAIRSSPHKKMTSNQIFQYIQSKHPNLFLVSNSMTWKGNIRQLLSKNPEFVKIRKEKSAKLHYWMFVPRREIERMEKVEDRVWERYAGDMKDKVLCLAPECIIDLEYENESERGRNRK